MISRIPDSLFQRPGQGVSTCFPQLLPGWDFRRETPTATTYISGINLGILLDSKSPTPISLYY